MHFKNPAERSDFVSGHRVCSGETRSWLQRFTDKHGLLLTLSGEGAVSIEETVVRAEPGELLLLHPNYQHRFQPQQEWDFLWFHFLARPHISYALKWQETIPGLARVRFGAAELDKVRAALTEAHELDLLRPRNWNDLASLLLESVLVRGFNRSESESAAFDPCVLAAQKLLLETDTDVDEIAARCGVSRAALYAKFKNFLGLSPRCYREQAMLRRAAQLLEQPELSIAEIAREIGMPDPYYFSTRFRKFFGLPPSEYRKR